MAAAKAAVATSTAAEATMTVLRQGGGGGLEGRSTRGEDTGRGGSRSEEEIRAGLAETMSSGWIGARTTLSGRICSRK
jgi:hypothetical protein